MSSCLFGTIWLTPLGKSSPSHSDRCGDQAPGTTGRTPAMPSTHLPVLSGLISTMPVTVFVPCGREYLKI